MNLLMWRTHHLILFFFVVRSGILTLLELSINRDHEKIFSSCWQTKPEMEHIVLLQIQRRHR